MKRNGALRVALAATVALLAAAVLAISIYEICFLKNIDGGTIFRSVLIFAALVLSFVRLVFGDGTKKLSVSYLRDQHGHVIGDVFIDAPKKEKSFFKALNLWNQHRYDAALKHLERLLPLCADRRERFAVLFFEASCYDRMNYFRKAIELYEEALECREVSTAASNIGHCLHCLGDFENARSAYEYALELSPKNAYAHNNLAQLYIEERDFERALAYALDATRYNAHLAVAWKAQAICHYMLGDGRAYRDTYSRAVACGADSREIDDYIRRITQYPEN